MKITKLKIKNSSQGLVPLENHGCDKSLAVVKAGVHTHRHRRSSRHFLMGFTLLESLVSIAILMVAMAAAFTIVPSGLAAGRYARNQITASSLAQEGMEVIRNRRDNGMYFNADGTQWLNNELSVGVKLQDCLDLVKGCQVDGRENSIYLCSSVPCEPLKYKDINNERIYGITLQNAPDSIFTRSIYVRSINDHEIGILVRVTWPEPGRTGLVEIRENLFNWWN